MMVASTRTACAENKLSVGLSMTHIQQPSAPPASAQAAAAPQPGPPGCPLALRAPAMAAALWGQPRAGAG